MVLLIQFGLVGIPPVLQLFDSMFSLSFQRIQLTCRKGMFESCYYVIINVFFVYTGRCILYEMIIDPYCIAKQKMTKKNQREKSESATFTYLIS